MRNKKILLTGALALVLCVGLASTLAFFTDSDSQTNTVVMGKVAIDLTEPEFEKNPNNKVINVVPNAVIKKDPTVTVAADSLPTYVRLKLAYTGLTAAQIVELKAGITLETGWKMVGDYVYYNAKLSAGDAKAAFKTVTIPNWGNEMASNTFTIDVTAEAVQADFFTPTKDADGFIVEWPGVTVE